MESIWALKNTPHWCGYGKDKGQFYHPGRGNPNNWNPMDPGSERDLQVTELVKEVAELRKIVAELRDQAKKDEAHQAKGASKENKASSMKTRTMKASSMKSGPTKKQRRINNKPKKAKK